MHGALLLLAIRLPGSLFSHSDRLALGDATQAQEHGDVTAMLFSLSFAVIGKLKKFIS
jgi:hypothetical protein